MDAAVRAVAKDGSEYVTMGLIPLSLHGWAAPDYNPLWLRGLLAWIRAHGRRFYNFEGLDAFKSKFYPRDWEPIFAISNEPQFSPLALYAIASAFSGTSPLVAVGRGLLKAVRQEVRWIYERAESKSESAKDAHR
jgi:phosphatidylglycerol lysyltransferase